MHSVTISVRLEFINFLRVYIYILPYLVIILYNSIYLDLERQASLTSSYTIAIILMLENVDIPIARLMLVLKLLKY
jgi:hypothetical protein